jgi:hypothetical protein
MSRGAKYEVDQWTVIMAIRYGMGRMTYANTDASRLARMIWPDLDDQQRSIIRDDADRIANGTERREWAWLLEAPLCAVCKQPLSGKRSGDSWRCDHCQMWRGVWSGERR